jgi:hypothetical protein
MEGTAVAQSAMSIDAGRSLARGDLVAGDTVSLSEGAELVVKSTASGRELALRGPSLAQVCPEGEEEIRLSWGTFRGFPGAGVRPGAEVWIATPFGVVRFNDADLEVAVTPPLAARIAVKVVSGTAVFSPISGARDGGAGEATLSNAAPFSAERSALPVSESARQGVAVCASRADRAQEMARAMLSIDAGTLGERAARVVEARRLTRVSCGSARALAALDAANESSLLQDIDQIEKRAKRLPHKAPLADGSAVAPGTN